MRRLSGLNNPGWRDVDPAAAFIAGMVAKLAADVNGKPVLQVADNTTSTGLIGLFYCHKTLSFYKPVVDESQTFAVAPNTSTVIYLNNANLKTGSVLLTSGGVDVTGSYTVSTTNGTVTAGSPASNTLLCSYLYQDPNLVGIDQTLGSGKAATLEDQGDIATLVYETGVAYALNGNVYISANGYPTATAGAKIIGQITKVPTSEDPELHFKLKI
ncbi:MAG TPA: hypothetical protein P5136_00345 [Methanofastidiosum sp.]|nr:hypothetical protein [Methanofastidiosum sp.]